MTFKEVQEALVALLKNPDEAQAKADEFLEKLKPDYENLESATVKVKEQEDKIRSLQDTNQQLFLKTNMMSNGENSEVDDEIVTPEDADEFIAKLAINEQKGEK